MAKAILNNPAEVKIAVSRPTEKIDQSAFVCHEGQKEGILKHLLKTAHSKRVIVFSASKLKVRELTRELRRAKIKAAEMHSDLDQSQRDEAMLAFRAGRIDVLVATDILARGIDIDDISSRGLCSPYRTNGTCQCRRNGRDPDFVKRAVKIRPDRKIPRI